MAESVRRVVREIGVPAAIELVEVPDGEAAERLRFLGSATVRVDGRDVEPGADERTQFQQACRVCRTRSGLRGQPDEEWVRDALRTEGENRRRSGRAARSAADGDHYAGSGG